MSLASPEACKRFATVEDPARIAKQLRQDQQSCRNGELPTVLAHFVPETGSARVDEIATHLLPQTEVRIPTILRRMQYEGVVEGIKAYLAQMEHLDDTEREPINPLGDGSIDMLDPLTIDDGELQERDEKVDKGEFGRIIRTLDDLRMNGVLKETDVLPKILDTLRSLVAPVPGRTAFPPSEGLRKRKCYICRFIIKEQHKLYPALCKPCGNFNLAEGNLSLPENLELKGRVALVTGGRINLGYHTALRLLRCGANVIVSTRYPQDAELRYRAEETSESWIGRLRIVGADFRTAKDVFRLVRTVKEILDEWKAEDEKTYRLFLLINNAAQTLTDPIAAEKKAIANESRLRQLNIEGTNTVISNGYEATLRGGSLMPGGLLEAGGIQETEMIQPYESYSSQKTEPQEDLDFTKRNNESISNIQPSNALTTTPTPKSSWMQSLHEIPYEDIITAHSVNSFVPLILIRELLPLMTIPIPPPPPSNPHAHPIAHILNISSREGIFESTPNSREKAAGTHVHTNMTKAGLNMITETQAASLWTRYRIAMNTVDPGYMSAAPEVRARKESRGQGQGEGEGEREERTPPIGFEDGAARVLWSVAVAEGMGRGRNEGEGEGLRGGGEGEVIWGRFLKHFGAKGVDVGLGR